MDKRILSIPIEIERIYDPVTAPTGFIKFSLSISNSLIRELLDQINRVNWE